MTSCRWTTTVALLAPLLLLTACAVGPDYHRPDDAAGPQWYATLPHDGKVASLKQWWAKFDDPLLAELIDEAEKGNPGLDQALARIAQSRAGVAAARAALAPAVDFNALTQRSESPLNATTLQTLRQASFDAAWEIDLFGGKRRGREAALARYEGAQASWHDARVSLAAEVAQQYVGLRACEALADATEEDWRSRLESERISRLKVEAGFESAADGALAVASTADAATRLSAQRAECEIGVKALVALSGVAEPDLRQRLAGRHSVVPQVAEFSVQQVPAQILMQRPDMVAAERELAATNAEIGVAEAARYPSVSLLGSIGFQSLLAGGMTVDGQSWSIGPSLSLPIFNAGRLAANADAARARYDEALAVFRGRARQAVREVEQALVRLDSASSRETDARRAEGGYSKALAAAQERWQVGMASQLELEEVRRMALASRMQRIGVQQERIVAWISLYRALGGGWSADEPVAAVDGAGRTGTSSMENH